jgi:hypothetical protein
MLRIYVGRAEFPGPRPSTPFASLLAGAAWVVATVIGAVLAAVMALSLAALAIVGAGVLTASGMLLRARRKASRAPADDVIEARNVGGHSWVAYGYDEKA